MRGIYQPRARPIVADAASPRDAELQPQQDALIGESDCEQVADIVGHTEGNTALERWRPPIELATAVPDGPASPLVRTRPDRAADLYLRTSYQRHWQPVGRVWSRKAVCDAAGSPDVQVLRVSIAANRMNPRRGRFRPTDFVTQSVGEPQQSAAEGQQTQGPTPFMGPLLGARRGWTPLIRVSSPRDTLGAVTFAPDLLRLLGHLRLNRFRDAT